MNLITRRLLFDSQGKFPIVAGFCLLGIVLFALRNTVSSTFEALLQMGLLVSAAVVICYAAQLLISIIAVDSFLISISIIALLSALVFVIVLVWIVVLYALGSTGTTSVLWKILLVDVAVFFSTTWKTFDIIGVYRL